MVLKPNSIIATDFDGLVVEHRYPAIGRELPLDAPCAIRTMKDLQGLGHKVIIWTCRYRVADLKNMGMWFHAHDFHPDAVNANCCIKINPYPKIYADVYLDDRNWPKFPGWVKFREVWEIERLLEKNKCKPL